MTASGPYPNNDAPVFDYLCVDTFIKNIVDARALKTAFELGFIDRLCTDRQSTLDDLSQKLGCDIRGLQLLRDLLLNSRVIEAREGKIHLSRQFINALKYRDLLEVKLEFSHLVAADFTDLFTDLVRNPGRFSARARVFDLFAYNRCFDYSSENFASTKRWMRITTALTKYEAPVCMKYHDFSRHHRMLDIGGNSGEFALRICKKCPGMSVAVFDLPLVCDIGREHIRFEPEANRITFIKGNALENIMPRGYDLITFKSMLHDWPEKEAKQLIQRAGQSLEPGGTVLIFERGPIEATEMWLPYSMIPFLLFFRSFRSPAVYVTQLEKSGFRDIGIQRIDLEMPFYMVTGVK